MFRFSIRELFLVTVIVAMGVAWWLDRWDKNKIEKKYSNRTRRAEENYAIKNRMLQYVYESRVVDLEAEIANLKFEKTK